MWLLFMVLMLMLSEMLLLLIGFSCSFVTIDVGDGNVAASAIDDAGGDGVAVEGVAAADVVADFDSAFAVSHPIALAAADVDYVDTDNVGTPALV
jgi:hypothetical protein